jgi:hypothetical protein
LTLAESQIKLLLSISFDFGLSVVRRLATDSRKWFLERLNKSVILLAIALVARNRVSSYHVPRLQHITKENVARNRVSSYHVPRLQHITKENVARNRVSSYHVPRLQHITKETVARNRVSSYHIPRLQHITKETRFLLMSAIPHKSKSK